MNINKIIFEKAYDIGVRYAASLTNPHPAINQATKHVIENDKTKTFEAMEEMAKFVNIDFGDDVREEYKQLDDICAWGRIFNIFSSSVSDAYHEHENDFLPKKPQRKPRKKKSQ